MRWFLYILAASLVGCSDADPQRDVLQERQAPVDVALVQGDEDTGAFVESRQTWFADAFKFCNDWLESGFEIELEIELELSPVEAEDFPAFLEDLPIFAGAATGSKISKDYGYIESSRSMVKRPEHFSRIFKRQRSNADPEYIALEDHLCAVSTPYGDGETRIPDNNNFIWDWNEENRRFGRFEQGFFQTDRDFEDLRVHKSRYRLEKAWGGSVFGFFMSAEHDNAERVSIFYVTTRPRSRRPFSIVYFATYPNAMN